MEFIWEMPIILDFRTFNSGMPFFCRVLFSKDIKNKATKLQIFVDFDVFLVFSLFFFFGSLYQRKNGYVTETYLLLTSYLHLHSLIFNDNDE